MGTCKCTSKGDPVPKGTHTVGYRCLPLVVIPHYAGTVYITTEYTEFYSVIDQHSGEHIRERGDKVGEEVLSVDPDLSQASENKTKTPC